MICMECHVEYAAGICTGCYERLQARVKELEKELRQQRAWTRSFIQGRDQAQAQLGMVLKSLQSRAPTQSQETLPDKRRGSK